jgi:hypothetical protein
VSNKEPIAPPWLELELVNNLVLPERAMVHALEDGRGAIRVGELRVNCTLEAWRRFNATVEDGFANLRGREMPARKGNDLGGAA